VCVTTRRACRGKPPCLPGFPVDRRTPVRLFSACSLPRAALGGKGHVSYRRAGTGVCPYMGRGLENGWVRYNPKGL